MTEDEYTGIDAAIKRYADSEGISFEEALEEINKEPDTPKGKQETTMLDEISFELMDWSKDFDDDDLGAMMLTGDFGYLLLHGQEADETLKFQKSLHAALDSAVDEEVWLDDERIKEREGELSDQAIFDYFERNIDERMFVENYLSWLADEMGVEYQPW